MIGLTAPLLYSTAPILVIDGVFLPVWIFCAIGGILAALVTRQVVVTVAGGPVPGLGAWFYLALAVCFGIGAYLICTGGLHL